MTARHPKTLVDYAELPDLVADLRDAPAARLDPAGLRDTALLIFDDMAQRAGSGAPQHPAVIGWIVDVVNAEVVRTRHQPTSVPVSLLEAFGL